MGEWRVSGTHRKHGGKVHRMKDGRSGPFLEMEAAGGAQ